MAVRVKCTTKTCPANAVFKLSLTGKPGYRYACRTHLAAQTEELIGTSDNASKVECVQWPW